MAKNEKAKPSKPTAGYRNPPVHSQFQAGQSGNPGGRPRGTINFATALLKTLRETVVINENGRRKVITKLDAAVKQLVNKAAFGDLRALNQLVNVTLFAEQRATEESTPNEVLPEIDQKVMLKILKRYEQHPKEEGPGEEQTSEVLRDAPEK